MSEAKKSKAAKKSKWHRVYKDDIGGIDREFFLSDADDAAAYVDDDGMNIVTSGVYAPDEALALAAWIVAWFGTDEAKP